RDAIATRLRSASPCHTRFDSRFLRQELMALAQTAHRSLTGRARASLRLPLVVSLALALLAVGYVAFVLWPRWPGPDALGAPPLPITVAGELFNVPPAAIRLAPQHHAGPPYQGEDHYLVATAPDRFITRCTRPGAGGTPGMCLFEQRIGSASVTVRFPREWLSDWRGLARAIEQLIASLRPPAVQ